MFVADKTLLHLSYRDNPSVYAGSPEFETPWPQEYWRKALCLLVETFVPLVFVVILEWRMPLLSPLYESAKQSMSGGGNAVFS